MESLNKARANLKHFDVKVEGSNIERFRTDVEEFFEEEFPKFFDKEFSEVSLSSLIQFDNVRKHFDYAEECLNEDKKEKALGHFNIAFENLVDNFEEKFKAQRGRNPLELGERLDFLGGGMLGRELTIKWQILFAVSKRFSRY